jgi:hypothetical protein
MTQVTNSILAFFFFNPFCSPSRLIPSAVVVDDDVADVEVVVVVSRAERVLNVRIVE